jgi:catechol 2,3-dioxygenase-like lactoylglutathione lyase family enzyme
VIQHVAFEIRRELTDDCVAFYALLGFERVTPPPTLAQRAAWVQREGSQIHLLFAESPVALPTGHVAVVVDAFDATFVSLDAAGHQPEHRPVHWGSPRAYVRDPAGNLVEIMAFPPA